MRALDFDKALKMTQVIAPKAYATGDSPVAGTTIDRSANGSGSVAFLFNVGAVDTAGLFTPSIEHSDNGSSWASAASFLSTALANTAAATKQETAYTGVKRYVRAVLTYVSGTSVVIGVTAIEARGAMPV